MDCRFLYPGALRPVRATDLLPVIGLCLAVCLATPGLAAPRADRSGTPDDPALRTPITLHLGKTPLSEVVAELGRKAGVPLQTSADAADEPAVVWVTNQPARDVMRHLAELFNYRWRRSGTQDAPRYELYQDLKSKQEEEALRRADRLRALQGLMAAIRYRAELAGRPARTLLADADLFDDLRKDDRKLPPAAREATFRRPEFALMERTESSWPLREMAGSLGRVLARLAASLTPGHWDLLLGGRSLSFSTQETPATLPLSPALARELRAARPTQFPPGARLQNSDPEGSRRLEQMTQDQWARAEGYRIRVMLDVPTAAGGGAAKLSLWPTTLLPAGFGGEQHMNATPLEISGEQPPEADAESAVKPPRDPLLRVARLWDPPVVKIDPRARTAEWRSELLPRIAETYGANLIADAYRDPRSPLPTFDRPAERPLYEVLNRYLLPAARWRKEGEIVRVRRRRWYFDRLAEISRPVADRWSAHLRKGKGFTLEGLAGLAATLRDEQLRTFLDVMRERGVDIGDEFEFGVFENREILRVYGSLLPPQRRTLRSGGQVAYARMPPVAQRWLQVVLDRRYREADAPPPAGAPPALLSLPPLTRTVTPVEGGFQVEYSRKDASGRRAYTSRMIRAVPPAPGDTGSLLDTALFEYEHAGDAIQYFTVRAPAVRIRELAPNSTPAPDKDVGSR